MSAHNYDVAVIDPSPGALIAAALLAKAGLSVLVLNPETEPPKVGPYRFVRHQPPLVGFGDGPLLTRCLKGLKFHPHEFQAVRKDTPGLQIISSRHRVDIYSDPEKMRAELKREFPRDAAALWQVINRSLRSAQPFADALDQAVENAGQVGLLQSLGLQRPRWNPPLPPENIPTWGEFVDEANLSDEARSFLGGLLRPFCALDVVEDLPLPVAGMHLAAVMDGVYMDPGEEHALLTLLLRRVRAMRVDVVPTELVGLEGTRRHINALHLADRNEAVPVEFVITGGDPEDLLEMLPGKQRPYQKLLSSLAPSHFRYSIFVAVQSKVVPEDLAEQAILINDQDPEGPGGSVLMTISPEGSALAPDSHRSITLSTLLPYAEDGGLPDYLDEIAAAMVEQVKWLMPYLEHHLELMQIPSQDDEDPVIAVDSSPVAYTPAIPPADDPIAAGLGVVLPHRNLFCAGPAAFPALGLGGQSVAGRLVERLSLASMKKKNE
jgi:phytoene dehydrogenase-like protein